SFLDLEGQPIVEEVVHDALLRLSQGLDVAATVPPQLNACLSPWTVKGTVVPSAGSARGSSMWPEALRSLGKRRSTTVIAASRSGNSVGPRLSALLPPINF
ncbi:MAG: hypothetical protein WBW37_02615, partial [Methyloceanibacter sp.]